MNYKNYQNGLIKKFLIMLKKNIGEIYTEIK